MLLDDILNVLKNNYDDKAYTIDEKSYTYGELYKFICNIYKFLLMENPCKRPVIVYGHKQIHMKVSILACSFAGITYIPVDSSMPKERVVEIVNQANPQLIIGDFEYDKCNVIHIKEILEIMENPNYEEIVQIYMNKEDVYYMIFTSGSTGKPKGVKITYSNLDSCVNWLKSIIPQEKGVVLNQANFSFDLSVADFYLSLVTASEHYCLENNNVFEFSKLFNSLNKSNATIAVMTPSFADLLLLDKSFGKELMPKLKTILFCGEKLLSSTVNKLQVRFKNINIINCYGPTECTFAVTSINVLDKADYDEENLPVGRAKDDIKIIIVDENGNKLEDGQVGEILISGASVGAGYLNYTSNAFIKYEGENLYLTGDLGYLKNDVLYCLGRKDRQIKYKAYRIELSDIEKNLYELGYIEKAIVLSKKRKDGKVTALIAFIKLNAGILKSEIDVQNDLQKRLPEYMCPKIKFVDSFPLTPNGKCDEKRLLEEY